MPGCLLCLRTIITNNVLSFVLSAANTQLFTFSKHEATLMSPQVAPPASGTNSGETEAQTQCPCVTSLLYFGSLAPKHFIFSVQCSELI